MRRPFGREREGCELGNLPHRPGWASRAGSVGPRLPGSDAYLPGRREAPAAFALAERVTGPAGEAPSQGQVPCSTLRNLADGAEGSGVPVVCTSWARDMGRTLAEGCSPSAPGLPPGPGPLLRTPRLPHLPAGRVICQDLGGERSRRRSGCGKTPTPKLQRETRGGKAPTVPSSVTQKPLSG